MVVVVGSGFLTYWWRIPGCEGWDMMADLCRGWIWGIVRIVWSTKGDDRCILLISIAYGATISLAGVARAESIVIERRGSHNCPLCSRPYG